MMYIATAFAMILAAPTDAAVLQDRTPPAIPRTPAAAPTAQDPVAAAREAELIARGETYRRSGDEEQDPAELDRTRDLNAGITARNDAAARREAEDQATWQAGQDRYQADIAAYEAATARADAENRAREAEQERLRLQWEAERAAWEAEVRAGEAAAQRGGAPREPERAPRPRRERSGGGDDSGGVTSRVGGRRR